jgi:hypothetical protein
MCIAVHPCWTGQPHRIRWLDEALSYILGHDGVWLATAGEIADYYYANCYERVAAHVTALSAA